MIWLIVGYSTRVNLQRDILAFLAFKNGTLFCNMALVSEDRGVAASTCFENIDTDITEMYILADGFECSSRTKYRVREVRDREYIRNSSECRLALIRAVSNSTEWFLIFVT